MNYYSTYIYATFLFASKAFDRLNYWLIFEKLFKKNVSLSHEEILHTKIIFHKILSILGINTNLKKKFVLGQLV